MKNSFGHYSGVTGNENADFTRCAARKAMDMYEYPCFPEFLPTIFRLLEGLAGYPTVMVFFLHEKLIESCSDAEDTHIHKLFKNCTKKEKPMELLKMTLFG